MSTVPEPELAKAPNLLAVVAEDRATAMLYRGQGYYLLETVLWPAMWGERGFLAVYCLIGKPGPGWPGRGSMGR